MLKAQSNCWQGAWLRRSSQNPHGDWLRGDAKRERESAVATVRVKRAGWLGWPGQVCGLVELQTSDSNTLMFCNDTLIEETKTKKPFLAFPQLWKKRSIFPSYSSSSVPAYLPACIAV
jgi:hypothetical protein